MKLSDKLIELRKEKGWSQEEFAEKLDVSRQAVSRWENETALPDAQNILRISKLFNVTADYLLNEDCENAGDISTVNAATEKIEILPRKRKYPNPIVVICFTILVVCAFIIGAAIGKYASTNKEQHTHDVLRSVTENEIAPGCAAEGSYDEVVYCTECDEEVLRISQRVAKLSHTLSSIVKENEIASTCTAEGSYDEVVYCSECGEEVLRISQRVAKLSHTLSSIVKENEIASTCAAKGSYDEVVYCTVCNDEVLRTQASTEMISHQFENKKCTACGEDQPSEGLLFMSNGDGTCTVDAGDCTDENIVISAYSPSGDKVVQIKAYAFMGRSGLKSVKIPETVTVIGEGAFRDCINLESVNLPSNITMIYSYTFDGCAKLKGVTIPAGVTYIGAEAFADCVAFESIVIPASVTKIGKFAFKNFSGCDGTITFEIYSDWGLYDDSEKLVTVVDFANSTFKPVTYLTFKYSEYAWRRN